MLSERDRANARLPLCNPLTPIHKKGRPVPFETHERLSEFKEVLIIIERNRRSRAYKMIRTACTAAKRLVGKAMQKNR